MENTLLGTWANIFGQGYYEVIDNDPRVDNFRRNIRKN